MKTKDVVKHFGSVIAASKALGVRREAIYQWGEDVPVGREYQLYVLTGGKLKLSKDQKKIYKEFVRKENRI